MVNQHRVAHFCSIHPLVQTIPLGKLQKQAAWKSQGWRQNLRFWDPPVIQLRSKWPQSHRSQLQNVGTVYVKQERVDIKEPGVPWCIPFLLNDQLSISWHLQNTFRYNEINLFMEWPNRSIGLKQSHLYTLRERNDALMICCNNFQSK